RVALRQHQQVVPIEPVQRARSVGVRIPGFELALLERRAAPVSRDPDLAVPRVTVAREDDRYRRAFRPFVARNAEEGVARTPGLREHEIRRVREVLLVVPDFREVALDGAVEADVEPR